MQMTGKIIHEIRLDERCLKDSPTLHGQTSQELCDFAEAIQKFHRISISLNLGKVVLKKEVLDYFHLYYFT